jgi:hypothetical protein
MRFFGGEPGPGGEDDPAVVRQAAQDAACDRLTAEEHWRRLATEFEGIGRRFSRSDEPPSTWRVEGRWWRRPVTGWPLWHVDSLDVLVARRSGGFALVRHAQWNNHTLPLVVSVRRLSSLEAARLQFETVCERRGVLLASVRCGGRTWGYPEEAGVLHPVRRLMAMLATRQDPNRSVRPSLVAR